MITLIQSIFLTAAGLIFLAGGGFSLTSLLEGEKRAAYLSAALTLFSTGIMLTVLFLPRPVQVWIEGAVLALFVLGIILFFLPEPRPKNEPQHPRHQIDERTIMFARARLEPGSAQYQEYYREYPHHLEDDHKTRQNPGLLAPQARFTDPFSSAAAGASFFLTESLREAVNGPRADQQQVEDPAKMTRWVKDLARYYGALDCGVTALKKAHIYSHIGRGSGTYGAPIELAHDFAVAFTVEMDHGLTGTAPRPTLTMESGRQYVESARVAVQLAAALRGLGYAARAHIDGNYRVIAPLVARDAGLGEIGRMGLLMTPKQGPRVRIGVVTTDLPLEVDPYQPDHALLDFCRICQKCAHNCPSRSIPFDDRKEDHGILRWKIKPDTCYRYWTVAGTDCGKCLAVCPYSHPDNWAHNAVRWGLSKSWLFRRAALVLDDFFYGKYPGTKQTSLADPRADHG